MHAAVLGRIRAFARLVYLNHGIHDAETGWKQRPGFTAAELRNAALAAAAAGADLGLAGRSLEYSLRALDGPLFDPRVDAQRTVHGADLTASAVNFYEGVTLRDLESFPERAPLQSRLVKQGGVVSERLYRLPAAADALDRALPWSAPPRATPRLSRRRSTRGPKRGGRWTPSRASSIPARIPAGARRCSAPWWEWPTPNARRCSTASGFATRAKRSFFSRPPARSGPRGVTRSRWRRRS